MIDNIDGFIKALFNVDVKSSPGSATGQGGGGTSYVFNMDVNRGGNMYCPTCCGERRMSTTLLYSPFASMANETTLTLSPIYKKELCDPNKDMRALLNTSFWIFKCTQCDTLFTVVFYNGANGLSMAVLPSRSGGVVTPNTPAPVAYYLDQAYKAKSVGANSACMAMYRGALDQLMYDQGYKEAKDTLGIKLKTLEKDIKGGQAPKWTNTLDPKYLTYLNALGSGSIHTNDGDIEKQKELDNSLLEIVDVVFARLLDVIYEQPRAEEERLRILEEKAGLLK